MLLFSIECEHGNHKHVFAPGVHQAAGYFITWLMANDYPADRFFLDRVTIRSKVGLERVHLQEALLAAIEGMGTYDEVTGWRIRPVEDERDPVN